MDKATEKCELLELDKESPVDFVLVLQAEIQTLKDQIAQNSRHRSKPPGSDGLKKPKRQSLPEKGKRNPGGQVGLWGKRC